MINITLSTGRVVEIIENRPYTSAVCTDINDPDEMTELEKREAIHKVHCMLNSGEIKGGPMSDMAYTYAFGVI